MKKKNFLITVFLVPLALIGCNNGVTEGDINSPRAVLMPEPVKPAPGILANKMEEWTAQSITSYSFVEKYQFVMYPVSNYSAKVTVTDNRIENIEILSESRRVITLRDDPDVTEKQIEQAQLEYNSNVEDMVNYYGTLTGIYEGLLAWNQEEYAKLGKNERLHLLISFNEQYQYPEYVERCVYTYKYLGDNTWATPHGQGPNILEISDFQVIE